MNVFAITCQLHRRGDTKKQDVVVVCATESGRIMDTNTARLNRLKKIGMYLLSLWLLFVLIFVNKIDIPLCWRCKLVPWAEVGAIATKNVLPLICIGMLTVSLVFYFAFARSIQGAKAGPFRIIEIEDKSADHLVFLATYIIPLVSFGLDTPRQITSLGVVLTTIGAIYVRTNLFYANPTLSLLGFKIYTVKFAQIGVGVPPGSTVLITREGIELNNSVNTLILDKNIFFARKAIVIKP